MAKDFESLRVDIPTIAIVLKLPRLFWLRRWLSLKLINLASIVSGGFVSFEIVEDDDADTVADAS